MVARSSLVRLAFLLAFAALAACGARGPGQPATPSAATASPADSAQLAREAAARERASIEAAKTQADAWRAAHRLVDMHLHIDPTPEHMAQAVRVMDAVGIGVGINLSGGTVTREHDGSTAFERTKKFADEHFPGRFLEYMNLDYDEWDSPDFAAKAVAQVEEGARLGAAGFKEFKRLGLFLRDKNNQLYKVDDARLDPMWQALGRLGMPVSIHVADPKAFWQPDDPSNERWKELKDHPRWWFGDPKMYPPREELLAALERVVARHPETTFVCVHFGNNAEDLDWVDAQLDRHPNMMVDIAARVPEIGRHDPERVHAFFVKHQDRILFATDFQSYDRMTLGSGGNGPPPTEADAIDFFQKHWRFFETADKDFPHMTPIQGDWTISAIHLPAEVLEKIYFGNASRLLAKPLAKLRAGGT
jgi:predicted TIM-barrel fold metal-dependent hydrolase